MSNTANTDRQEAINDLKKTQAAKRLADDDEEIMDVLNKREDEQKARVRALTTSSARVAGIRAAIMRKEEALQRSKAKSEQLQNQLDQEEKREQNILKEISDLKAEEINLLTNPSDAFDKEGDTVMDKHPARSTSPSRSTSFGRPPQPQMDRMESNFAMLFDQIKTQNYQIQQIQNFISNGGQQAGSQPPATPQRHGAGLRAHATPPAQHTAHLHPPQDGATPTGAITTPLADSQALNAMGSVADKGKDKDKATTKPFSRAKQKHLKTERRLAPRPSDAGDDMDKENEIHSVSDGGDSLDMDEEQTKDPYH